MTNPSPGPWRLKISEDDKSANIFAADGYHVVNIDLKGVGAKDEEAIKANRELELANGVLQAAAPILGAALETLLTAIQEGPCSSFPCFFCDAGDTHDENCPVSIAWAALTTGEK